MVVDPGREPLVSEANSDDVDELIERRRSVGSAGCRRRRVPAGLSPGAGSTIADIGVAWPGVAGLVVMVGGLAAWLSNMLLPSEVGGVAAVSKG